MFYRHHLSNVVSNISRGPLLAIVLTTSLVLAAGTPALAQKPGGDDPTPVPGGTILPNTGIAPIEEAYESGLAAIDAGDFEGALADLTTAIDTLETDPLYHDVYTQRAYVNLVLGDNEAALADANSAIERGADGVDAYRMRGYAANNLGRFEAALADWNNVIENADERYADDYYQRGYALFQIQDFDPALEDFNAAIEMDPSIGDYFFHRAFTYSALRNEANRLADCDRALNLWQTGVREYEHTGQFSTTATTLREPGEQIQITFEGLEDVAMDFELQSPEETGIDAMMVIYAPDGAPIACNVDYDQPTRNTPIEGFVLPETGTYRILVGDIFSLHSGEIDIQRNTDLTTLPPEAFEDPAQEPTDEATATDEDEPLEAEPTATPKA